MRPIQILANNLLYDIGQAAIPTDAVDVERIERPRTWDIEELTRFIFFIGHVDGAQFPGPIKSSQLLGIAAIGFDPVAGFLGNERG